MNSSHGVAASWEKELQYIVWKLKTKDKQLVIMDIVKKMIWICLFFAFDSFLSTNWLWIKYKPKGCLK